MRTLWLLLSAAALAPVGALTVTIGDMPTAAFQRHRLPITLANPGGEAVTAQVELEIIPPVGVNGTRVSRASVAVPAGGEAEVALPYELFNPGPHGVKVRAKVGEAEPVLVERTLEVPDADEAPLLFPNAYRRRLTVVGGREVSTSYGPLTDEPDAPLPVNLVLPPAIDPYSALAALAYGATPAEARAIGRVDAVGDGTVSYSTSTGQHTVPVTIAAGPGEEPLYGIDPQNRLRAGGEAWFPLGIYHTPTSPRAAEELAEAGFDLVRAMPMPGAAMIPVLDAMGAAGLRVWVPIGHQLSLDEGDAEARRSQLRELVEAVGDHPALAIWESYDEPAWNGRSAHGLREGYEFLRALDPERPLWTNHAPRDTIPTLAYYNRGTDIAGCDVYPVPMPQTQSNLPNKTLGVVGDETLKSVASVMGEKPVFMVLQGFAWRALRDRNDPEAVYPTFDESRFMAYDAITHGANGILYWGVHTTPRPSPFWSDLKSLVSELAAIRPVLSAAPAWQGPLAGLAADPARAADTPLWGSHRVVDGHDWLLIVNRSERPQTLPLKLPMAGWRALFGDSPDSVGNAAGNLAVRVPAWGVRVLTTDPDSQPQRRDYSGEAAQMPAPVTAPREEGNLIPNPSFEAVDADDLPLEWMVRYPFLSAPDADVARSGETSLRLEAETAELQPLAVVRNLPVEAGGRYRLSAWFRAEASGDVAPQARAYVEWVVDGRFHAKSLDWVTPGTDWEAKSLEFTVEPDPRGPIYAVVQMKGPGRVWFDDIKLEAVE